MLKKGLVLIAVPLAFQILFTAVLLQALSSGREAQDMAIHTKDVIAQGAAVSRMIAEVQGQSYGMVLTDDPGFGQTAEFRTRDVPAALARLRTLVEDDPKQLARVDEIAASCQEYLSWQSETRKLSRDGRDEEAVERVRTLAGKGVMDRIREQVEEFLRMEQHLDAERRAALERTRWRQTVFILAGVAAAFLIAVGMLVHFDRTFARRVAALVENARRLGEGKPLHEPTDARDEIGEIDRAFHALARALEERDRENEMFIYSVSHDLRSPLVNLQGFSKELEISGVELRAALGAAALGPDDRRRVGRILDDFPASIHFIQNAVMRLSGIIDALLRLSRAGRVEYHRRPIDMNALVGRVVEALRVTASERGASITVGDLPPAFGDETALEQIFANLAGNALSYLDPARPGRIEIGGAANEGGLNTYYVRDNGLGIAEAHQAKLFTAFQRLHPGVAKGEGIGLSLVRRMVERHGGRIWVESCEDFGSTFSLTLPAVPPDSEPERTAANDTEDSTAEEPAACPSNR